MDSLIFAVNAVFPIILMVSLGYALNRIGYFGRSFAKCMNKLVFHVLLPCMLFSNIYKIQSFEGIGFGYIGYVVIVTLAVFFLVLPFIHVIGKTRPQRAALWQGTFRSNYALVGLPLASSLFGETGSIVASVLSAVFVPLSNMLSVLCLSIYGAKDEKPSVKQMLLGIVKNPLIQAIALGGVCLGVRAIFVHTGVDFRLSDITPIYSVIEQLAKTATPMALLALGARFEFSAVSELKRQIVFGTLVRTAIVPSLALGIAYAMDCFNGAHFAAFVAAFATPIAISSVPMTQEMGGDEKLAGQLVVWTTLSSAVTIFLFTFILKAVGVFV